MRTLREEDLEEGLEDWLDLIEALSDLSPEELRHAQIWASEERRLAEETSRQLASLLETASRIEPAYHRVH
jgi:hypothetical protein